MKSTVEVNREALRKVLNALVGPSYAIRELQAIRDLPDSPITQLINDYNKTVVDYQHCDGECDE